MKFKYSKTSILHPFKYFLLFGYSILYKKRPRSHCGIRFFDHPSFNHTGHVRQFQRKGRLKQTTIIKLPHSDVSLFKLEIQSIKLIPLQKKKGEKKKKSDYPSNGVTLPDENKSVYRKKEGGPSRSRRSVSVSHGKRGPGQLII